MAVIETSPEAVRRLAVERQLLAGAQPKATAAGIAQTVDRLGRVQLDPTSAVARSHLLVLWSRIGPYRAELIDRLIAERRLFEAGAFLRPIDQLPLVRAMSRHWPAVDGATRAAKITKWLSDNAALRDHVLAEIHRRGPLGSDELEDRSASSWRTGGYFDDKNVGRMLEFLEGRLELAVAGRRGTTRVWDLPERVHPPDILKVGIGDDALMRQRVERSLRAMGVASRRELNVRGGVPGARPPLGEMASEGLIRPVTVTTDDDAWRGEWFVHRGDVARLRALRVAPAKGWGRTTLLSPFDNLIADRDRTERLFGFHYRNEIYVPVTKRRYGYFVMPILHGDRLIGRADPRFDRASGLLLIKALHAEPDAPHDSATARRIAAALDELAAFLGGAEWRMADGVPSPWRLGSTARGAVV